jgi:phage gp36-like protein
MAQPQQFASAEEFLAQENANGVFDGVPTPAIDQALQWSSREMLGYVAKRKILPLVSWGDDLRACCARMAAYDLIANQGYAPLSGSNEVWETRYLQRISWLVNVSRGLVELVDCVDSSPAPMVDVAGPLAASDPIVNWNFQTRGRCGQCGSCGCNGSCNLTDGMG